MTYTANLGTGQQIWIGNQGTQTTVTLSNGAAGQQQSQRMGFQTGQWIAPPTLFRTAGGFIVQLATAQGDRYLQVQGSSLQGLSAAPNLQAASAVPLESGAAPSMPPMPPIQPMQMGNMRMQMNPMQMKMGDLELKMGDASSTETPTASSAPNFCAQCGQRLRLGDRFCASCGHQVSAIPNS